VAGLTDVQLSTAEQDIPEPPKIFHGDNIKQLTHFDGLQAVHPHLSMHVKFANAAAEHRESELQLQGLVVNAEDAEYVTASGVPLGFPSIPQAENLFSVVEISTELRLRWQDGHETIENSLDFKPYRNVDE
jgi:hypothetical protein